MAKVYVDNQEIELADDERLNGIQAARLAGAEVPHYCWHPGLSVVASCRMCLVETGRKDAESGEISMMPKLVPACQTPATDGTVFVTDSEKVRQARAMVEEDLLLRHPIDCPICDKAGECSLQDYHFQHGRSERRADIEPFTSRRRSLGDTVTLFVDRCVMCSRCVRFCREVAGTSELMVSQRGAHEEIDVFPGFPLENGLSGNVVDLCPVGALGDKDFLYSQRVWFMQGHEGVCAGCSTGCNIEVEENQSRIYRLKPRENQDVNQWWMCDEGRYDWKYVHDENRLHVPAVQIDGQGQVVEWSQLIPQVDATVKKANRIAAVLSPFLTSEEAHLLADYIRSIDSQAILVLGHVPIEGDEQTFPTGFTIRNEKCPNRRGIEAVLEKFGGPTSDWQSLIADGLRDIDTCWLTAGYPKAWHDESVLEAFAEVNTLIIQDIFDSPLWQFANYQLPAATFVERSGTFVNHDGIEQSFDWSIRPPVGVQVEGQIYWQLLQRPGMYDAEQVREEMESLVSASD